MLLNRWKLLLDANRVLWKGTARRMLWLKWFLCAGLLSDMAFCPRLWISDRPFPTVPVVPGLPDLPQAASVVLVFLLVLSVLVVAVAPEPDALALAPPVLGGVLVVFDIDRLQPWCYQYLLMFAALALMRWREPESARSRASWACCGIALVGVYFWSGTHKLNATFAHDVFPFLLKPLGVGIVEHLKRMWFLAPIVETSVGILLTIPRTRAWGLGGAMAMHGFLLAVLGPFGLNYNSTVWPWNFWVAAMAFALFLRNDRPLLSSAWQSHFGKVILALFGVLPALNYFNLWDGFLSASFYSGKLRDGWIYFNQEGADRLPARYKLGNHAFTADTPGRYRMDITDWSMSQMNVPPYAEPRAYVGIVEQLRAEGVPGSDMTLLVRDWVSLTSYERHFSPVEVRP